MARWDHRPGPQPGMWVVHRDDVEVASVCFLPEVSVPHVRMDQFVALMATLDAEAAAGQRADGDEWRQLGWQSQVQHELHRRRARAMARAHREPVQQWLRAEWVRLGYRWPLTPDQMATWELTVRDAPARIAQALDYMGDEEWASIPLDEFVHYEPGLMTPEVAA